MSALRERVTDVSKSDFGREPAQVGARSLSALARREAASPGAEGTSRLASRVDWPMLVVFLLSAFVVGFYVWFLVAA